MRIFFAGASGVIGSRLVPLLVDAGHTVGAMTRSAEKAGRLAAIGTQPIVAQSVAWTMRAGAEADAVASLEEAVLAVSGVVLRYGMFYGPGTYFERELPPAPRVHIDTAAARTLEALDAPPGILTVVE